MIKPVIKSEKGINDYLPHLPLTVSLINLFNSFYFLPLPILPTFSQSPLSHKYFVSLTSHPQSPDYLLAGTETGLYESSDGGQTWALKENNLSASSFQTLDSDSEDLVAYLFGEKEGLYLSEDFGETWASLNFKVDDDYIMYISNHPTDDQMLVLGSMKQSIYETKDFGKTWEVLAEEGSRKN